MNGCQCCSQPDIWCIAASKLRKRHSGTDNPLGRLPPAIRNALWNDGIKSVEHLTEKTEAEIRRIPGIGKGSVAQIRVLIASLGLTLSSWPHN